MSPQNVSCTNIWATFDLMRMDDLNGWAHLFTSNLPSLFWTVCTRTENVQIYAIYSVYTILYVINVTRMVEHSFLAL